ncbi:MAG: ferritin-like domain-containing protein [Cyanobacteria bacterium P01_A01_bin.84]
MKENNQEQSIKVLQKILEFELQGVIRYTYYCVMLDKKSRESKILDFLKEQAQESLHHAQLVGDLLVKIKGYEPLQILPNYQLQNYSVVNILMASKAHEQEAIDYYNRLLEMEQGCNSYLEEFASKMVIEEGEHSQELKEMINEYKTSI